MGVTDGLPIREASARLDERVHRARTGGEPVILTDGDAPVAAIISIEAVRELQQAQDDADIAICRRSQAHPGRGITHDELMALLAAEDAAGS